MFFCTYGQCTRKFTSLDFVIKIPFFLVPVSCQHSASWLCKQTNTDDHKWYKQRFGKSIDCHQVLPVLHAQQGHPELWEEHITKILSGLGFKSTTHKRNIYVRRDDTQPVLLLRQVDDFIIATHGPKIAARIYSKIGRRLQLPGKDSPPFEQLGLVKAFNGVDILQTRDYINVSCPLYIR
jgi:hypothetical protein